MGFFLLLGHLFLESVSVSYLDLDWTDFDHMTKPRPASRLREIKYRLGVYLSVIMF